jgi:hypothetical protein
MSHLTLAERVLLEVVAEEILELLGERGHHVTVALDADDEFRVGNRPRSAMIRALVIRGFKQGAWRAGIGCSNGRGGTWQIHTVGGSTERIYRLLRAVKVEGGGYRIEAANDSILHGLDADLLLQQAPWVYAYTCDSEDGVAELFAAPVLGYVDGKPGHLTLGEPVMLGAPGATDPGKGFKSTDDGLEGFDEDDLEEDGGGLSGSA